MTRFRSLLVVSMLAIATVLFTALLYSPDVDASPPSSSTAAAAPATQPAPAAVPLRTQLAMQILQREHFSEGYREGIEQGIRSSRARYGTAIPEKFYDYLREELILSEPSMLQSMADAIGKHMSEEDLQAMLNGPADKRIQAVLNFHAAETQVRFDMLPAVTRNGAAAGERALKRLEREGTPIAQL